MAGTLTFFSSPWLGARSKGGKASRLKRGKGSRGGRGGGRGGGGGGGSEGGRGQRGGVWAMHWNPLKLLQNYYIYCGRNPLHSLFYSF